MTRHEKNLSIIGAGGHAKVVIQTARAAGYTPVAIFDDNEQLLGKQIVGVPIVGKIEQIINFDIPCVIAIGDNETRKTVAEKYDLNWVSLIHPSAVVDSTVQIGLGTVIFALAAIQPEAKIGHHVIINTSATVDHDCVIDDFTHIAPGVHLSGGVTLGKGVMFGVGACAKPSITLGNWSTIGSGAVVITDFPDHVTAVGVPAKIIRKQE